MSEPILYGEKLREIINHFGIDPDSLDDRLYSTLLKCICDCVDSHSDLKNVITSTGCIAFPYSVVTSFDDILHEDNTEELISTYRAFENCSNLINAPMMNTSNVVNAQYMFYNCTALTTVPEYDFNKVTDSMAYGMFDNCTSLKSVLIKNIKCDLDLSASTAYDSNDLGAIIKNLAAVSGKTLTLGETNLAKLSSAQSAIAIGKGWALA